MKQKWQVLVVDDDVQICELIHDYLSKHGYRVLMAHESVGMRKMMKQHTVDLIILDIMMPGQDGISLCRQLREESDDVLVIMLSAMGEETDRIVGLEVGADDYLPKPFSPRELLARIKSLERLVLGPLAEKRKQRQLSSLPVLRFDQWRLDQNKRRLITDDNTAVPLSSGEYDLLQAFLENPNRVLTRDQLLDITRGRQSVPFDRTIDVQVGRLRKKIETDVKEPKLIMTVRGGGYQFTADVSMEEETR